MAKRFLRLDLSSDGRDFVAVALEPGLPLLDKANANFRTLRKWLGRFIAEPEWHGKSVDLFVCDEQEGRMVGVSCEPITAGDLQRNRELKQDLGELVKRLEKISPEPKEVAFHKAVVRHFRKTIAEAGSVERDCHLFKYRDGGVWRLVWSWGYQRKDLEPGAATTCTNPDCNLLFFVRHSDDSRDCPHCVAAVEGGGRRSAFGFRTWALLLVVALIAGGLGYAFRDRFVRERPVPPPPEVALQATPEQWVGPPGAQIRYAVIHRSANGQEEDVTTQVVVVAEDPKVVQLDELGGIAHARTRGKTAVHFYYSGKDAHATVEVVRDGNPTRLLIEPAKVTLGLGTTAKLRVLGEYKGGKRSDLTEAVEWESDASGSVYCYQGQLEGVAPGKVTLVARYRATSDDPYLTTETTVTVVDEDYQSLELKVTPNSVAEGKAARVEAYVTTSDNQQRSVLNSSLLDLEVDPPQLATIDGEFLRGSCIGVGKLKAVFDSLDDLSAEHAFEIHKDLGPGIFEVTPKELRLVRGEISRLQVVGSSSEPVHLESSNPAVVELLPGRRVAARSVGTAEITVQQEAREKKILAEVRDEQIESIAFVPSRISVPVDASVSLRLVARYGDDRQFDVVPDQITSWQKVPTPTFAELNMETLELRGRAPTGDNPQTLEACWGELRASAQVDVGWSPSQVELTPTGPVALHIGEVATLRAVAKYGDGRRAKLSASRLRWRMDPSGVEGLDLDQATGAVRATKGGVGPVRVVASYLGFDSNPVEFCSLDVPFTLALESDRSVILVDHTGRFRAFDADNRESNLQLEGVRFESSDEKVISLNPQTGEYQALSPGTVTVTASHPHAESSAQEDFQVLPAKVKVPEGEGDEDRPLKPSTPEELRIVTDQPQPIVIPVQSDFADFRVEGIYPDNVIHNLTRWATLNVESDNDPQNVPLAVQGGQLRAQCSGMATIQAEYNGVSTSQGLRVEVVDDPELKVDSLEIQPSNLELPAGETRSLRVLGFLGTGADRRSLGDLTAHPALKWSIDAPDVAQLNGPDLTGLNPGSATVTVTAGNASGSAAVAVGGHGPQDPVVIQPDSISLKERETVWLETDITMTQGGEDVGNRFQAMSSDPLIFSYNPNNRSISGVSPGQADLHVTVGASIVQVPVFVKPEVSEKAGRIVVEPTTGRLTEGESQELHVILVTDDGERIDRTGAAVLEVANSHVLAVRGTRIVGLAPGNSEVTASLPGTAVPGKASFLVEEEHFARIDVTPPALQLDRGYEKPIHIYGIGPRGRRELSHHPDLRVTPGGENPDAIQWHSDTGTVRGIASGHAELRVTWRDLVADPVPIEVSGDPPTELRIEPTQATIDVGDRARFSVFATQGNRQRNVTADDGVVLRVGDTSIASGSGDLILVGTNEGTTEVTAWYDGLPAVAILRVGPPQGRTGSGSASDIPGPPPHGRTPGWTGLRFIPDILRLQLGVPGASVRVVRVSADGQQEDVDHRANIQVGDPNIVDVSWTASGPVFVAKKLGRTEATASQGSLATRVPLQIQVVDPPSEDTNARLEVRPNPMQLFEGGTGEFRRVQIVPGSGAAPVDVDYRVQSNDESIVGVEGGKILQGRSAGRTRVTVTPVGVGEKYEDLSANVTIDVEKDDGESRLVLNGPSQTTELAEVEYRAELVGGHVPRDVTDNGAVLVLDPDQQSLAEVRPGCNLIAKQPGTINVRARYNELISNVLQLRIHPNPKVFERVELEIDRRTISVGESRSYKVWGYPMGNGPRYDLTSQVVAYPAAAAQAIPQVEIRIVEPAGNDIVSHSPPELVARSLGKFQLAASLAPDLRSEVVNLEITEPPPGDEELRLIPRSITVHIGERTPRIRALARSRTGGGGRDVNAQWASENEALLAKDPQSPGRFAGKAAGKTRLKATFGDLEPAFVDVTVKGDPFRKVTMREKPDWKPDNRFAVTVDIEASEQPDIGLEYRLSATNDPDGGRWVPATVAGDFLKASLTSPDIRQGPEGERYHLRIEARDKQGGTLDSYPLSFRIFIGAKIQQQESGADYRQ
jgi:hypothetical protein